MACGRKLGLLSSRDMTAPSRPPGAFFLLVTFFLLVKYARLLVHRVVATLCCSACPRKDIAFGAV